MKTECNSNTMTVCHVYSIKDVENVFHNLYYDSMYQEPTDYDKWEILKSATAYEDGMMMGIEMELDEFYKEHPELEIKEDEE